MAILELKFSYDSRTTADVIRAALLSIATQCHKSNLPKIGGRVPPSTLPKTPSTNVKEAFYNVRFLLPVGWKHDNGINGHLNATAPDNNTTLLILQPIACNCTLQDGLVYAENWFMNVLAGMLRQQFAPTYNPIASQVFEGVPSVGQGITFMYPGGVLYTWFYTAQIQGNMDSLVLMSRYADAVLRPDVKNLINSIAFAP